MSKDSKPKGYDELYDESRLDQAGYVKLFEYVIYDSRLTPSAILLYTFLKSFAFSGSKCFPGIPRLSSDIGCSERTVLNNLDILEKNGLINRKKRFGDTTLYTIHSMTKVYFESTNPPRLKDFFVRNLWKKGERAVKVFERILIAEIPKPKDMPELEDSEVSETSEVLETPEVLKVDNVVEEERVRLRMIEENKLRAKKIQGNIETIEERSQKALEIAKARKSERLKHGIKHVVNFDPTHEEKKLHLSPLTAKDLEAIWFDLLNTTGIAALVPDCTRPWTPADWKLAKTLMIDEEPDRTIRCVSHILRSWNEYKDRFRVKGIPSLKIIMHYRSVWFPEIEADVRINPMTKRDKALMQGEYTGPTGEDDNDETISFF